MVFFIISCIQMESAMKEFMLFYQLRKHICQGSHRLEKYLNLEGFLEKSLKTKSALKST